MGDGANDALANWVHNGMPDKRKRNVLKRIKCPFCLKTVHGEAALMQHINAKHSPKKKRYSIQEIDLVRNHELYGES